MSDALLSVEDARERVLAAIPSATEVETHAPENALWHVLAEPVVAATDLPPWDNSAMDGYAIRAADVAGATADRPVRLRVIGEVPAGGVAASSVEPGMAIRIATGAPVPAGADAVVPVEETTPIDAADTPGPRGRDAGGPLPAACLVHLAVAAGGSIRHRGEDVRLGGTVLAAGAVMTPAAVAIAAGSGSMPSPSIGVRGSPSWPPATRSARRGSRSVRRASPMPMDRACGPWSRLPGPG